MNGLTNLKRLRTERGYSQNSLAVEVGITPFMVSYLETGRRVGSLGTIIKIADVLNVSIDELVGRRFDRAA